MATVFNIRIDLAKSNGSYVFDKCTNDFFLDLHSMYSSLPLGYNHPVFDASFYKKIVDAAHVRLANNIFHIDELDEFCNEFIPLVFSSNIHFTCTGALAVESAIKAAMHRKKVQNPLVIGVRNSFHGINSWGFLTDRVGINEKRLEFFPRNSWLNLTLDEIISFLTVGDVANLVAVVIEPVQCTNGDIYLDRDKLKKIHALCVSKSVCFILDEIQTGFGVTGKMWYYEHLGIVPDILVFGKKSQICGICIGDEYSEILHNPYQKLDVTFDGELIDAIRASYVLRAYRQFDYLNVATANSTLIRDALSHLLLNYRSIGHLIAFDFLTTDERNDFVRQCYLRRLLVNRAGDFSVRLRPNLAISKGEIEHFIGIVRSILV